jgi:hypothetical protein
MITITIQKTVTSDEWLAARLELLSFRDRMG